MAHVSSVDLDKPLVDIPPQSPNFRVASTSSLARAGDSATQKIALACTTISTVISTITLRVVPAELHHYLRTFEPHRDVREAVLAGVLPDGRDPLDVLDVALDTLGVLYILCVSPLYFILFLVSFLVDFSFFHCSLGWHTHHSLSQVRKAACFGIIGSILELS